MKVAGIVTAKYDKARGLVKGDVIELAVGDKIIEAVKEAVAQSSKSGKTQAWAENVLVTPTSVHSNQKGDKFHGKYSHNHYKASGEVVIRTMDVERDKLLAAKKSKFEISFCDCLDEINQPDIKIDEFKII